MQKKQDKPALAEPQRILNEGQAQMEAFRYNPVALGKPIKTKQVSGVIEQPWYQRLMASGSFQVLNQFFVCSLTHSLTHSLTYSLTQSFTHPLAHSLTHSFILSMRTFLLKKMVTPCITLPWKLLAQTWHSTVIPCDQL